MAPTAAVPGAFLQVRIPAITSAGAKAITLFVPCYVDRTRPQAGIAAVELLERLGYRIEVRSEAYCCGQPFTNSGCAAEGSRAARLWYEQMVGTEQVVVLSSSCAVQLRHLRPSGWPQAPIIEEFCQFLRRQQGAVFEGNYSGRVALHSSCHGLRDSDSDSATLSLLSHIAGLELVQAERRDECCGFGGHFSVKFPALSIKMGRDRLRELRDLEVDQVVATDVSCLLHLHGIAAASGLNWRFRHVAELLRDAVVTPKPGVAEVGGEVAS